MAAIMIQRRAPWSQPWSYWQEWLQPPTWGKAHAHEANADQHFVHTFFLACFFFNLTFGTDALLVLWAMLKIQKPLEGLMQLIPRCQGKDWKWARRWPELPAESLFSTKGAVRRPMTYDDHQSNQTPSNPTKPLNELHKPQVERRTTSNELIWTKKN